MITLTQARAQWVAENPFPLKRSEVTPLYPQGIELQTTQAEYDAMADDRAQLLMQQLNAQDAAAIEAAAAKADSDTIDALVAKANAGNLSAADIRTLAQTYGRMIQRGRKS